MSGEAEESPDIDLRPTSILTQYGNLLSCFPAFRNHNHLLVTTDYTLLHHAPLTIFAMYLPSSHLLRFINVLHRKRETEIPPDSDSLIPHVSDKVDFIIGGKLSLPSGRR